MNECALARGHKHANTLQVIQRETCVDVVVETDFLVAVVDVDSLAVVVEDAEEDAEAGVVDSEGCVGVCVYVGPLLCL